MPEQFKFHGKHRTVLAALSPTEINKVTVWQGPS